MVYYRVNVGERRVFMLTNEERAGMNKHQFTHEASLQTDTACSKEDVEEITHEEYIKAVRDGKKYTK